MHHKFIKKILCEYYITPTEPKDAISMHRSTNDQNISDVCIWLLSLVSSIVADNGLIATSLC